MNGPQDLQPAKVNHEEKLDNTSKKYAMDLNGERVQYGGMTTATLSTATTETRTGYTIVSRHRTSQGEVLYVRCDACQKLRMLSAVAVAGGHAEACPFCR